MLQVTLPSNVSETISRLSAKPNVKATMVLDRSNNAILQTSGSFVSLRSADSMRSTVNRGPASDASPAKEDGVEEFAGMISSFVLSAGGLVHDLDTEVQLPFFFTRLLSDSSGHEYYLNSSFGAYSRF
jgi:dynein light chain roadblock-type